MKSLINTILIPLLATSALLLIAGCATQENSDTRRVSTVPWNKPQRWEGQGQMGAVAEAMGATRPGSY